MTETRRVVVPAENFWDRISPEPNSGCWLWTGAIDRRDGYGRFYNGAVTTSAHRFAYQTFVGEIPTGLTIDHKCRVRSCVNPLHLRVVSNAENVLCGNGLTAINARKTECSNGHAFTPNNTMMHKGGRTCKICHRLKMQRLRHKWESHPSSREKDQ